MAKSEHNNINQYNFAGIEGSRPDPQLKTLSPNFPKCGTDLFTDQLQKTASGNSSDPNL